MLFLPCCWVTIGIIELYDWKIHWNHQGSIVLKISISFHISASSLSSSFPSKCFSPHCHDRITQLLHIHFSTSQRCSIALGSGDNQSMLKKPVWNYLNFVTWCIIVDVVIFLFFGFQWTVDLSDMNTNLTFLQLICVFISLSISLQVTHSV